MEPTSLGIFLLIACLAGYIQTVTGFAFGLIMVGAAAGLELAPISFTAIVVSFNSLAGSLTALKGSRSSIQWTMARPVLLGLAPAMLLGLFLLHYLNETAASSLKLILGATILAGGIFLMLKPTPYAQVSRAWRFSLAGAIGGVFGGLFSVSGPPIVYHLYRQPLDLFRVKTTLLVIFGAATLLRIILVGAQGAITTDVLVTSLLAMPLVMAASYVGKRWPPAISEPAMRRCAFLLLAFMGLALMVT